MCTVYVCTYLPHVICVAHLEYDHYMLSDYIADELTGFLYCFSAVVNALITLLAKDDFRDMLLGVLKGVAGEGSKRLSRHRVATITSRV